MAKSGKLTLQEKYTIKGMLSEGIKADIIATTIDRTLKLVNKR